AVHGDVAVGHELACLRARLREAGAVHGVVEAGLEVDEERLARGAGHFGGAVERVLHLALEHAVHAPRLLLLTKLKREVAHLTAALLVHARRGRPLLEGALGEALLSLEEELHALAAADPADRTGVSRHALNPPPLRRAASVVWDRRDVGDRGHREASRLERADRGLAARPRTAHEDLEG